MPIQKGWPVGVTLPAAAVAAMARAAAVPEPEAGQEEDPVWRALSQGQTPVRTASTAATLSCPGTIVRIQVDASKVVGYGYDAEEASWCDSSNVYYVPDAATSAAIVASYPTTGPILLSGYVTGEDAARGKAAVVDAPMGAGHVVLLGPNTLYRAQATRTYMFFWNSLIEGARRSATSR